MKRLFAFLLALCLMLGVIPLAYAEDGGGDVAGETVEADGEGTPARGENPDPEDNEAPSEKTPAKASTFAELQAALSSAEDGDIIEISEHFILLEDVINETDKHITLKRSDDFRSTNSYTLSLFSMADGHTLKGFEIVDAGGYNQTIDVSGSANIIDCHFDGGNAHYQYFINVDSSKAKGDKATISGCTFTNNKAYSVKLGYNTEAICESCTFINNGQPAIDILRN